MSTYAVPAAKKQVSSKNIKYTMRGNPFACLGSKAIPVEHSPNPINMAPKQPNASRHHTKSSSTSPPTIRRFSKVVPPIPSINLAAKSLITSEPFVESYMNRDYNFIFRSRPLDSCKYEPYKVILLIA
eukprot:128552_1